MTSVQHDLVRNYQENEAAEFLRCSPRTLQHWRQVGGGPRYVKVGRRVLYRPVDLVEFLSQRVRRTTRDSGDGFRRVDLPFAGDQK